MISENKIYYPEKMNGEELDEFLELGWYRMGQSVFTTHFIMPEDLMYRVFWLRYNVKKIAFSKSQQRIINKNQQFNVSVKPLEITDELEKLYANYKTSVNFTAAASVYHWLFDENPPSNVFDTKLIEIKDKDKLIAVGIYDQGAESIAGIMNFYHPDYKKFSLGKYLLLLKIALCKAGNLSWYYPGYVVYQRPEFDYKLSINNDAVEILVPELKGWQLFQRKFIDEFGLVM